jgi:fructan beta-fructosidase
MTLTWPTCLLVVAVLSVCHCARAGEPELYGEPNRPQYHFTPKKNWMNDPNGLVFFDGEYHLFYQYNPQGDTSGHLAWGHAIADDLLHWRELPVALTEDAGVMIYSGSAVIDAKNTSGFGQPGRPAMIVIYAGHGLGKETQNIAYSVDKGRTWTKFAGNPVIDENLKEFRDPKVFWHEPSAQWVMVVAVSDQRKVRFYGSKDLKAWKQLGDFGGAGELRGVWECPDLFQLPADSGGKKWVLVVNVSGISPAGGPGCQYFIGDFDGRSFQNDNPKNVVLWADHGSDFYAASSWSDIPPADGRRIWIAWMADPRYAYAQPTHPWRSAQSIPRELSLQKTPGGLRLAQTPVRELETLRGERIKENEFTDAGQMLEIVATMPADVDSSVTVCGNGEHGTVIGYDAKKREMFVDRGKSSVGPVFHKDFSPRQAVPLTAGTDGKIRLHIFVDQSSVEVFGNDGVAVMTDCIFPSAQSRRLSSSGPVSLEVWKMKSIWPDAEEKH